MFLNCNQCPRSPASSGQTATLWGCCNASGEKDEMEHVKVQGTKPNTFSSMDDRHEAQGVKSRNYDLTADVDVDVDSNATTADTALSISTPSAGTGKSAPWDGSPSKEAPEDFSGSWMCTKVTGDMEKFLEDMGLNEALRKAAGAANYGAGRQFQNIAQVGNSFVVQNILKFPVTMRFHAGAGVQTSVDQEGKPIVIDPYWDGDVLCVTSKRESGELIANTRRYLEGSAMVLQLESPAGTKVKRIFERR